MLTSGPTLQIIRQQPSGAQAFRDLARRYNPGLQARSLAQLQEIMHFQFGQEPAGVTDQLIVSERLVGDYETSSGEVLGVQVKCAVLLERMPPELRTYLLLTCGSRPDYTTARQREGHGSQAIQRQWEKRQWKSTLKVRKANTARARRARRKAKESTKVNTIAVLSLRPTGHCGK